MGGDWGEMNEALGLLKHASRGRNFFPTVAKMAPLFQTPLSRSRLAAVPPGPAPGPPGPRAGPFGLLGGERSREGRAGTARGATSISPGVTRKPLQLQPVIASGKKKKKKRKKPQTHPGQVPPPGQPKPPRCSPPRGSRGVRGMGSSPPVPS